MMDSEVWDRRGYRKWIGEKRGGGSEENHLRMDREGAGPCAGQCSRLSSVRGRAAVSACTSHVRACISYFSVYWRYIMSFSFYLRIAHQLPGIFLDKEGTEIALVDSEKR